jgi:hypothetical protein
VSIIQGFYFLINQINIHVFLYLNRPKTQLHVDLVSFAIHAVDQASVWQKSHASLRENCSGSLHSSYSRDSSRDHRKRRHSRRKTTFSRISHPGITHRRGPCMGHIVACPSRPRAHLHSTALAGRSSTALRMAPRTAARACNDIIIFWENAL